MNAQGTLARLNGVRRNGNGWMALCPAHADKNASLSIRDEGGKILIHCFAGCTVEAICAALGMTVCDLFTEPRTARRPEPAIVRSARQRIADLRSRLTRADRERSVTVVLANEANIDAAIARALALAVEGELVQVAIDRQGR